MAARGRTWVRVERHCFCAGVLGNGSVCRRGLHNSGWQSLRLFGESELSARVDDYTHEHEHRDGFLAFAYNGFHASRELKSQRGQLGSAFRNRQLEQLDQIHHRQSVERGSFLPLVQAVRVGTKIQELKQKTKGTQIMASLVLRLLRSVL